MSMFEKSCGGIVYRKYQQSIQYLLIFNRKGRGGGHWGFAKGHVEHGESEIETALREIKEETGLDVKLLDGFKESTCYSPKVNVLKRVVYFLAEALDDEVIIQQEEVADYTWATFDKAQSTLTNVSDKKLLKKANDYMEKLKMNS